jgi:hypothetical protein
MTRLTPVHPHYSFDASGLSVILKKRYCSQVLCFRPKETTCK